MFGYRKAMDGDWLDLFVDCAFCIKKNKLKHAIVIDQRNEYFELVPLFSYCLENWV